MDKIPLTFQVAIVNHSPMENSGFTLCRARVFYTGLNRNGSYISKEFAENFIKTASGCPVVGLWDYEKEDFTDHSASDHKRAYGFIPENPNFAWENAWDYSEQGEHEYATFDIVLWTKAFKEANQIITHPLSMEINPDTINGTFSVINGEYCFYFTSAEMLGVCVLGYDVEPCFEGARFIDIEEANEFKRLFQIDKQQALLTYNNNIGETSMENEDVKTPVENFTEIRDDDIEINASEELVVEVNESLTDNNNQFTMENEEAKNDDEDFSAAVEKFTKTISELEAINADFKEKIQILEDKISKLEEQNFSLEEYKNSKIKEEKEQIINNYKEIFSEDELNELDINKFSAEDLDDKLAAMAYRKNIGQQSANFQLINTNINENISDDITTIVNKYRQDK